MKCLKMCCRINEKLEPLFWLITLNGLVNPLVYLGKIDTTVAKKIICNQGKVAKEFKSKHMEGKAAEVEFVHPVSAGGSVKFLAVV